MNRAMRTVENGNLYIGIFNRMMWATRVITDQVCVTTCVTAIFSAINEFSTIYVLSFPPREDLRNEVALAVAPFVKLNKNSIISAINCDQHNLL